MKLSKGKPAGFRLLVKMIENKESKKVKQEVKRRLNSIIELTEKSKKEFEDEIRCQDTGTSLAEVIQVGSTAFKAYDDGEPWCKVGDTISIASYAGQATYEGNILYRIINDEDVLHVWTK